MSRECRKGNRQFKEFLESPVVHRLNELWELVPEEGREEAWMEFGRFLVFQPSGGRPELSRYWAALTLSRILGIYLTRIPADRQERARRLVEEVEEELSRT